MGELSHRSIRYAKGTNTMNCAAFFCLQGGGGGGGGGRGKRKEAFSRKMKKNSTCSRYDRMTYSPKIVGLTKVVRKEASNTITYVVILERKGEKKLDAVYSIVSFLFSDWLTFHSEAFISLLSGMEARGNTEYGFENCFFGRPAPVHGTGRVRPVSFFFL